MFKGLDWVLGLIGLAFIGVVGWDCYKSTSHLPEGLWYVARRAPDAYPAEIQTNISQIQTTADQRISQIQTTADQRISQIQTTADQTLSTRTAEISAEIRKQVEESKTGCISISGFPNLLCVGAKQTTSPQPSVQPQQ